MKSSSIVNAQSSIEALPDAWIDRLFCLMEDRYGALWADRYGAFPRERVMGTWARDLADMTRSELERGMDACRNRRFPPTLPELREMCRPAIDYERAFIEAVNQMRLRDSGGDVWSSPAVYWAAVQLGKDLTSYSYTALAKRWAAAMDDAYEKIRRGELANEVPARRDALPAPGQQSVSKEQALANLARIKEMLAASQLGGSMI